MIPDVAKTGSSFKGALAYYLHDKKLDGEEERLTSERVAWTETRNLMTDDPEMGGKVMAATAMDSARLKQEAGIRNTGRKSDQHVYAYSLAWHPEESGKITRADMRRAVDETLRVLGAEDRQAIIVCHRDANHPHVHVIVNRVSPQDGRILTNGNDHLKLSQWALHYREARNEQHYCPRRAENWDIRLGRHQDKDRSKYWRASGNMPRSMIEEVKKGKAANDEKTLSVAEEQKRKAGRLAADGQVMKDRHASEWEALSEKFKGRKDKIYSDAENGIRDAIFSIKASYRPEWQELGRKHSHEREALKKAETGLIGKIKSTVEIVTKTRQIDPDSSRGILGEAYNLLANEGARSAALERIHKIEASKLSARQRAEIGGTIKALKADRTALLASANTSFLSERAALIESQAADKERMKSAWRRLGEERKRAFATSRKAALSRQNAAAEKKAEPEAARESRERGEKFKAASMGRKPRATGRSRSRKRSRGED